MIEGFQQGLALGKLFPQFVRRATTIRRLLSLRQDDTHTKQLVKPFFSNIGAVKVDFEHVYSEPIHVLESRQLL